jgi:pimeloyl-ACP methyl ester carboxylesterase
VREAAQLHVTTWGDGGETAVLVHGSLGWGESAWAAQRPLADHYRLLLVDRRGFGSSSGPDAGDFDVDADSIAELLPSGAHLVGHSYGGVASLLAAARRPDAVRSLTVIEPPALGLVRGDDAVEEIIARVSAATREAADPQDYTRRFFAALGLPAPTEALDGDALRAATSSWRERAPWEAEVDLEALRRAPFPKLVVRGAWDVAPPEAQAIGRPAFHAVCDVLVEELGAESATISGVAHSVQRSGEPLNKRLRAFWESA